MIGRKQKILGIAVEDGLFHLAELQLKGKQYHVVRADAYELPETHERMDVKDLGTDLNQFLREHHYGARDAIVGVPAKWLLEYQRELPVINGSSLANMIVLQSEREFSIPVEEMVLDYSADTGKKIEGKHRVFVMAMLKKKMDVVVGMAKAAGLKVHSVTPTSVGLNYAMRIGPNERAYSIFVRDHYAELAIGELGGVRSVKHYSLSGDAQDGAEQAMASLVRQVSNYHMLNRVPGKSVSVTLWDTTGRMNGYSENLKTVITGGGRFEASPVRSYVVPDSIDAGRCLTAAGLAAAMVGEEPLAIDFLHTHINPEKKAKNKKPVVWGGIIVAALILVGLSFYMDYQANKENISVIETKLAEMESDINQGRALEKRVAFAEQWQRQRPKALDCLYDLTEAFPQEGSIWLTSLVVQEDMQAMMSGKASDERVVLDVMDTIKGRDVFKEVKIVHLRDTGRNSQDVAFEIKFIYTNGK